MTETWLTSVKRAELKPGGYDLKNNEGQGLRTHECCIWNRSSTDADETMGNRIADVTSHESSVSEDNFFLFAWFKTRRKEVWPCLSRRELVQRVERQIQRRHSHEELMVSLSELRKVFGLETQSDSDIVDSLFVLNERKRWKVQKLLTLIEQKLGAWPKAAELSCQMLIKQISPRLVEGKMPIKHVTDLNDVNLAQVVLHRKKKMMNRLKNVLQDNPQLKSLELGYTGLDNTELMELLPIIGRLEELHYLGLSGNRLNKNIIDVLMQFLRNPANLPTMRWTDLQNNEDIFALPLAMLSLLRQRWPLDLQSQTNFRQLADSDAILVIEDIVM
ncbi:Leucine-rich repeat-containing protein 75A [Lamellibrachia satsuma]|nr:Leucine-rich repeat-containing protein 75A [Lamellibrachia satsuma]